MVSYTVMRNERREAPDGSGRTEIFVSLEIDDGEELYPYGYWLSPAEVDKVLADESKMDEVIASIATRGERFLARKKKLEAIEAAKIGISELN